MKKEKLYRKIFLTRCSRIVFSEELKNKHDFYQTLIIYYTVAIIGFSILEITTTYGNSIYILITSIALAFFTVSIQSQRHLERYLSIKQHYIKLDDLSQRLEGEITNEEVESIRLKYIEMLDQVENHKKIHLLKHIVKDVDEWKNKDKTTKIKIYCAIFLYDMKWILSKGVLILLPILLPVADLLYAKVIN